MWVIPPYGTVFVSTKNPLFFYGVCQVGGVGCAVGSVGAVGGFDYFNKCGLSWVFVGRRFLSGGIMAELLEVWELP